MPQSSTKTTNSERHRCQLIRLCCLDQQHGQRFLDSAGVRPCPCLAILTMMMMMMMLGMQKAPPPRKLVVD